MVDRTRGSQTVCIVIVWVVLVTVASSPICRPRSAGGGALRPRRDSAESKKYSRDLSAKRAELHRDRTRAVRPERDEAHGKKVRGLTG